MRRGVVSAVRVMQAERGSVPRVVRREGIGGTAEGASEGRPSQGLGVHAWYPQGIVEDDGVRRGPVSVVAAGDLRPGSPGRREVRRRGNALGSWATGRKCEPVLVVVGGEDRVGES